MLAVIFLAEITDNLGKGIFFFVCDNLHQIVPTVPHCADDRCQFACGFINSLKPVKQFA